MGWSSPCRATLRKHAGVAQPAQVQAAAAHCVSSAPTPLIPPRLTENKAQHEGSIAEQALEAELLLASSSMLCVCALLHDFWLVGR